MMAVAGVNIEVITRINSSWWSMIWKGSRIF